MKKTIFLVIFIFLTLQFQVMAADGSFDGSPLFLLPADLPGNLEIVDKPSYVGKLWLIKGNNFNPNDLNCEFLPGYTERIRTSDDSFYIHVHLGKFDDAELRQKAKNHIVKARYFGFIDGSFLGNTIGDMTGTAGARHPSGKFPTPKEVNPPGSDDADAIFSKGSYIYSLRFASKNPIDFQFAEGILRKLEKKVTAKIAADDLNFSLSQLISQKGILQSLQVKLNAFNKQFAEGDYKTGLNNINSFVNELDAQRGKHVSESAYQTLKGYADTIVQLLNVLMQK